MTKLDNPWKVGDVKRYVLRPICKKLGTHTAGCTLSGMDE